MPCPELARFDPKADCPGERSRFSGTLIAFRAFFDQLCWCYIQMRRDPLKSLQGDILLAAFHGADMGTVDIHRCRQRGLRQPTRLAVVLEITCKNSADIHPQLKSLSRILVRRIIMLICNLTDRDPFLHRQSDVLLWTLTPNGEGESCLPPAPRRSLISHHKAMI